MQISVPKILIHGNAWMAQQLELGQLSIGKLRKLFQIQGSEKAPTRKPKNDPASSDNKGSNTAEDDKKGHGRNGADAYQGAAVVDVVNPELNPGDTYPAGVTEQKYDATFIAMLMINKYFMAVPLYRQDTWFRSF